MSCKPKQLYRVRISYFEIKRLGQVCCVCS